MYVPGQYVSMMSLYAGMSLLASAFDAALTVVKDLTLLPRLKVQILRLFCVTVWVTELLTRLRFMMFMWFVIIREAWLRVLASVMSSDSYCYGSVYSGDVCYGAVESCGCECSGVAGLRTSGAAAYSDSEVAGVGGGGGEGYGCYAVGALCRAVWARVYG